MSRPEYRRGTISSDIPGRALAYDDDARRPWVADAGEFDPQVGASSADLPGRPAGASHARGRSRLPAHPPRGCPMLGAARMAARLGFGIIGCGVIGRTHATVVAALPEARLGAVADEDPARGRSVAEEHGATPYTDIGEMLGRADLDVVDICTPSGLHSEHVRRVMRSGRHAIVEKPMEITRAAMDRMLRAQTEAGAKLAVISQHRFDPASRRVHDLAAGGRSAGSCSARPTSPGGGARHTTTAARGAALGRSTAAC